MGAGVGVVATDGYGNETVAHLTDAKVSPFFLATARGKIASLKANGNDNDKMGVGKPGEMFKMMRQMVDLKTGKGKEMAVRGCGVLHYKDPEDGKDLEGWFSVSGNMAVDKD